MILRCYASTQSCEVAINQRLGQVASLDGLNANEVLDGDLSKCAKKIPTRENFP